MTAYDNLTSITFLYPSKRVGGAQLLFIRLAKELSKVDNISVNVVDYFGGFLQSEISENPEISFIPYINGKADVPIGTTVITPLSNLADLKYMISGDLTAQNVLFWSIHPSNLSHVFNSYGRKWLPFKENIKSEIIELALNGNIIYMDKANFLAVKNLLNHELKPKYLPIPIEFNLRTCNKESSTNPVNIGWLGRVSFDKINSIFKIIDEIQELGNEVEIIFHIIGNGEKMSELKSYLNQAKIKYVLVDSIVGDELHDYICNHIDIGISMGTSCMEFAAREKPSLLIDYSFVKFPKMMRYNWLFETEGYTLGNEVNPFIKRNHTFREAICQFSTQKDLGKKCHAYVIENHQIKEVSRKLIDICEQLKPIKNKSFNKLQRVLNPFYYQILYRRYRQFKDI